MHWYYQFQDVLDREEKQRYIDEGALWEYKGDKYYYLKSYNDAYTEPTETFKTMGIWVPFGKHPPYEKFKPVTTV